MTDEEIIAKIEEYIAQHYVSEDGARSVFWSEGNYGQVFTDGAARGRCRALWSIADIIGMEVDKPAEQERDWS